MFLTHRIARDPNHAQASCFVSAAGTARFACNRALAGWRQQFEPVERKALARSHERGAISLNKAGNKQWM